MALEVPLFLQGGTYSARLFRQLVSSMFSEGILGSESFVVTQRAAGANFSVDIAVGRGVIDGDNQANQGSYLAVNTAIENKVIPAAPGSNSRYDIVILQINDPTAGGDAGNTAAFEIVSGTAAASPTVPATPATAIRLATIGPITSGTSSITTSLIADTRTLSRLAYPDLIDDLAIGTAELAAAAITTAKIADSNVTTAKLATGAVTTPKLADNAVDNGKLANNAVGTSRIADSAVTEAKLATAVLSSLWTGTTPTAGWAVVAGTLPLQFKKVGNIVYVTGVTQRTSGTAQAMTNLPVGYRPTATLASVGWGGTPQQIEMRANGDLWWGSVTNGVPLYVNIFFPAA